MFQREDDATRRRPLEERQDNDDYNSPPEKKQQSTMMVCHLDVVRNGGASKEGVRRGGRQRESAMEPVLPSTKLMGSLDNNDDKKYTINKQQMMVVDNGWDGKGHSRK